MFLDRTYNFQIDNGLFVVEHLLKKDYKEIELDNLKDSVDMISEKMLGYTKLGTLASQSHHNSALNQPAFKENRLEKIKEQLNELLDNIGKDKTCMQCGQKRVNLDMEVKSSYMALIPSMSTFANTSNNLQCIDICPVCLFLAYVSFLNTQKISFAFVYMSDSDEFMRDKTKEIQLSVSKDIFLEMKRDKSDNHFLEVMSNIAEDLDIYDDMNYIDLIYYANAQNNHYETQTLERSKLLFLMKLKNQGLIYEFASLKLFRSYFDDALTLNYIVKSDKKDIFKLTATKELYKKLEEEIMTNKEIEMIDYATSVLLEHNSAESLFKELKMCNTISDFEKFILKHSFKEKLFRSLLEFDELKNIYKYKNMLIANLIINQ